MKNGHVGLGSREYIDRVKRVAAQSGNNAALHRIMGDVAKYGQELDPRDTGDSLRLYRYISSLIARIGHVDQDVHYFRNKLNRTPETLNELRAINEVSPPKKRWKLYSVRRSLYHMQGEGGSYNLKFVSGDGFCEAVYNRDGVLLTEENDPVNMGTFNYAAGICICRFTAHQRYDVVPYLIWGNTADSPQKGVASIKWGVTLAARCYKRNSARVDAYRKSIMKPHRGKKA